MWFVWRGLSPPNPPVATGLVLALVKQFTLASSIETFLPSRYYSHVSSFSHLVVCKRRNLVKAANKVVHLARCVKHKACTIQIHLTWMNHSHDPCLLWIFLVLIYLGLIWTSDCLSSILAFTVVKHDTTSTADAYDFSIFWTCSIKPTTNDCKYLNVNRNHSKN